MGFNNLNDLIRAWDNDEIINTIEMGGLGPGYEQAIQTGVFETVREFLNSPRMTDELKEAAKESNNGVYNNILDTALRQAMEKYGKCLDGLSGAQAGAIKSLVGRIVLDGHQTMLDKAKEQGIEDDRFILVSKNFP